MASQWPPWLDREELLKRYQEFPTREVLIPALKVGAGTGTTGLLTGGVQHTLLASPLPTLYVFATGTQWFLLGTTFWTFRSTLLYTFAPPLSLPPTPSEQTHGAYPNPKHHLYASTVAGTLTGGFCGGLFKGRANIVPGMIMFTIFGYTGQRLYNWADRRHTVKAYEEAERRAEGRERGFLERVTEMRWSPARMISDAEYAGMLRDKMLKIEADIALVDEEMERLRDEEKMKTTIVTNVQEGKGTEE